MPTIADLRSANPWADDISDLELLNYRAQQTGTTLEDAAKAFGVKYNPNRNAASAGFSAGVDELQGLGYGVLGAGARAVGLDSAADWADKNVRINSSEAQFNGRPDLEDIQDQTLGSMPAYLAYQGAKQLPILGGTIAASAVMPEAVIPAALSRGLAYAPRAIGGGGLSSGALNAAEGYAAKKALTNEALQAGNHAARIGVTSYPMSVASLYNEAVERGDPTQGDALAAFAGGVPYAAGEAVMPAIVNRGLRTGGLGFTGNMPTRMAKAAGVDALGEAGTELFQNELEMGFAGPLTDEQKFSRRLNSAVAGGMVGGMFGAPAGIRAARTPVVPGQETDLLGGNDYPALPSPNQMPIYTDNRAYPGVETIVDQANDTVSAQRATDELWAARNAVEERRNGPGAQDLLGDPLSYPVGQEPTAVPAAESVFGEQARVAPEATVTTPNRRQMSLDFDPQNRPEVLYGNPYNPASPVGPNGVQGNSQAGAFTQRPITDEIRQTPGAQQQAATAVNGVRTVAQLKATADQVLANGLITPDQHVEFMNEVDTNRRMKLLDKKALLTKFIEKNNGTQTQEAVPPTAGQQAAVPVSGAAPVNATQPEQLAPQTLQTEATQIAPDGQISIAGKGVTLADEQQRVVNYVQQSIDNNELDNIVDAQGKLRAQDIALALGIKNRGSVAMALKGARERIAAAYGVSVDEVKSGLKTLERNRRSVEDSTQQKLGLSPDQQAQGVDEDQVLGQDAAFGVVDTPAQAQANVDDGNRVESPDLDKEDPVRKKRDLEANVRRQRIVDEMLNSSLSGEAAQDWDDMKGDGVPSSDELDRETAYTWVSAYTEWKQGELSENELAEEQRNLEREVLGKRSGVVRAEQNPTRLSGDGAGVRLPFASATRISGTPVQSTGATSGQARELTDAGRGQGSTDAVRTSGATDQGSGSTGTRQSRSTAKQATTAERIKSILKPLFFTNSRFDNKVTVVDTFDNLPPDAQRSAQVDGDTQAFVLPNGRAYLIADRIDAGHELAVFLHEVGVHLGMEKLLGGKQNFLRLAKQIVSWYDRKDNSPESRIANLAIVRTTYAAESTPNFNDTDYMHEVVAYFVEEAVAAGYTPNAVSEVGKGINAWLKALWDAAKNALRKFGIDRLDSLTVQDVVDLSFAAAHQNITGRNTESEVGRAVRFSKAASVTTPDGFFAKLGEHIDDLVSNPAGGWSQIKLGWMTLEQIADRVKSEAVKAYTSVMTEMQRYAKHIVYQAAIIDQDWSKLSTNTRANLSSIMRDATRMGFDPDIDTASSADQQVLKDRFNKTLTNEARDVYRRVRDHYKQMFEERKQILMDAAANGTLSDRNKAEVDKMFTEVKGPYFPLMRLGNWYAVGMSKELATLQAKVDAGEASAEEQDRYRTLRKDKAHYITKSFDTRREAKRFSKDMAGQYDQTYFNTAKSVIDNAVKSTPDLAKMQDYLTAGMPQGARDDLNNMLAQMYFDMLPDSSPLKRMMKREGVYGEEEDMRKVFAASSISMAHHVSRLKYANKLSEHLVSLDKETKRNEGLRHVYNELVARANLATKTDDTPFADSMTQMSYFAHLGLSPAFILTNMTQVPMITAPWLTARYGFNKTKSALAAAYVDAYKIIKGTMQKDGWEAEYNWSDLFKAGSNEDKLLNKLLEMNLIDITMEHDLGAVARIGGTGNRDTWNKVVKVASLPVRATEAANRIVTALSSYRLAMDKGMSHDDAVEHAAKAISETQLNYSALNAPRYMQSVFGSKALAKMVFQFRKYQQGMVYLIAKNAKDAFKGDREAMKTLIGVMGTTGLMAGATGLPFAGSVFWMATVIGSAFDDDDEPFDARESFRNYLAETFGDQFALAVSKGLPTLVGMDISGNVGMGNIGMPLPYVRDGKKPSDSMKEMLASAAGASFGTMMEMADGFGELIEGDIARGAQHVVPLKLAKNMIKAADFASEGMVDSKGNIILPAERFDGWDLAFRASGFTTTKESEYYEANSAMQKAKAAASDTRNALLREYSEARLKGEPLVDFQDKVAEFNTRHPEKGVRIDQSSLLKAVQARKKLADDRTETGLRRDKTMKPYLERAGFADGE